MRTPCTLPLDPPLNRMVYLETCLSRGDSVNSISCEAGEQITAFSHLFFFHFFSAVSYFKALKMDAWEN